MKKENRQIVDALILVFQFGLNMLVPIFMCCALGIWLGRRTGISWMMVPFFFIGALAGGTNVYRMAKKIYERDNKERKDAKKN